MNETYTKLRDFAQKRLDDSCENDCNNDVRYWVGYLVGLNALYKKLYKIEETLEIQIPKNFHFGEALGYKDIYWYGYFDGSVGCAFYLTRAIASIENASAVDVQEIKHGEWKSFHSEDTLYGSYYCSACGHEQDIGMVISLTTEFKYCPNCGAKMDGGIE